MDRKGHDVGHIREKPMHGIPTFKDTHFTAVPNAVFGKQIAEGIGWVPGVAQIAVVGLQHPDLFGSFQSFESGFGVHRVYSLRLSLERPCYNSYPRNGWSYHLRQKRKALTEVMKLASCMLVGNVDVPVEAGR